MKNTLLLSLMRQIQVKHNLHKMLNLKTGKRSKTRINVFSKWKGEKK